MKDALVRRWMVLGMLVALVSACGGGGGDDIDARIDAGPMAADAAVDAPPGASDAAVDATLAIDGGADAGSGLACDPVQQSGCQAGERCDLASGAFRCVADGTLGDFARCSPSAGPACAAGLTCSPTFYQDTRCQRFCAPSGTSTCRPGDRCQRDGTTADGTPYHACTADDACDPFAQDCATVTDVCTFAVDRTLCLPPAPSPVDDGASCTTPQQCRRGSACLPVGGGQNRCFRLCDPDDDSPGCGTGVACSPYADFGPHPLGACGF